MKSQTPAEGILKRHDWGDSKVYQIICDCGQDNHTHNMWVEADGCNISVTIYVDVKSPWYSLNRFKQIWTLLSTGYLQHETSLAMSKQQALNYADTLKKAIQDVEKFRQQKS
jgi:transposase